MVLWVVGRGGLLWKREVSPLSTSASPHLSTLVIRTPKEHDLKAYVSVLSTQGFVPGVLVLWESLKRTDPRHEFYLLVTQGVSVECEQALRSLGLKVLRDDSEVLASTDLVDRDHRWRNTFDKIKIFNLVDFEKLVYLDADMYVCRNLDDLFEKPHFSAVENRGDQDWLDGRRYFNSGLMVIAPSADEFRSITSLIEPTIRRCLDAGIACGDQNVLNMHVADWPDRADLHLDDGYNVFWGSIDQYLSELDFSPRPERAGQREINVVHFTGKSKPWRHGLEYRVKVWLRPIRGLRLPSLQAIRLLHNYFVILRSLRRELGGACE